MAGQQGHGRSWPRFHRGVGRVGKGVSGVAGSGGGCQRVLAEFARGVIAAAGELAGYGQGGQPGVAPVPGCCAVAVIRAGGLGRALGCLVQRPAQQRRSLPGQVPGRALAVGGADGDVQPGVPDHVVGAGEPAHVAEPGPDRHRGDRADAVLGGAQGGGLAASVDRMRFVVPIPTIYARPNRKFFGPKRGITWLNMINDQAAGLGAKVVSGTPRDSLHMIDVLYARDGGQRPDIVVTDTGSYSDLVFGLVHLLGMSYRPQLADLPDQQLWRIRPGADYGPLNTAARGKIDPGRIRRHWPDILRVAASIHTGTVRAYDVIRMLQRDGHPTPLGEAIAGYGRIFKSLHVLTYVDDEAYRRGIKGQSNLIEGRHDLARTVFHGHKGEIYQRYHLGMEEQLGALGLVLNCIVLWNTFYMNAAAGQLRADGYPIRDEDLARLSPFVRHHLGVHGRYSFVLPDLAGGIRPLRDPDADDDRELAPSPINDRLR